MGVLPALGAASAYTWFVGVVLAGATYFALSATWNSAPIHTPAAVNEAGGWTAD
jgi:cytosine/uracil/thiamine/allantoin permease